MNVYIDSSAILRLILGEPGFIEGLRTYERKVCSDISTVECMRVLDRMKHTGTLSTDELADRRHELGNLLETMELVEINKTVLKKASDPLPVVLGTLDAIHLATALLWHEEISEELIVATHDRALGNAARIFGFSVIGL
jgi:predicted nucleic acid-binding protein